MAAGDGKPDLSAFQLEVARLFFSLPASQGFLLAGGAALLAQHLTARPTEDLDFFTAPECGHVPAARDALEAAASQRGWSAQRIHDSDTFCGWSSAVLMPGSWLTWPLTRRRTFLPPRPQPGRRLRQKN
jgi:Nucleotidyl transferase AbiEii toxin, Type IV TA system